ncbi:hypothetical protein SAMN06265348_104305 [Pedobacter westerhofensis]|uniref:Uncharacterized protein n=1 Tax=Pedobacter westerhofensis TaxID=425512 RepID=A0A521CYA1_9SPHI|nr:hypothetical protein SAMN06265348_104305 [Pedobacter westerhofensis]
MHKANSLKLLQNSPKRELSIYLLSVPLIRRSDMNFIDASLLTRRHHILQDNV